MNLGVREISEVLFGLMLQYSVGFGRAEGWVSEYVMLCLFVGGYGFA